MSDYETILIEREGRVARVSFNRPDKLNSFNGALRREFLRALSHCTDTHIHQLATFGATEKPMQSRFG